MTGDLKTKDFHLEVKALTDEGTFEGYGSVFNNVDSYGERVAAGAFAKSLAQHAKAGTSPLMLWQHDPGRRSASGRTWPRTAAASRARAAWCSRP